LFPGNRPPLSSLLCSPSTWPRHLRRLRPVEEEFMIVSVPHEKTQEEVVVLIDNAAMELFADAAGGGSVKTTNTQKEWNDSTMTFSLTLGVGFIEVPLAGSIAVDEQMVTVFCDVPPMIRLFVGVAKIQVGVQRKLS